MPDQQPAPRPLHITITGDGTACGTTVAVNGQVVDNVTSIAYSIDLDSDYARLTLVTEASSIDLDASAVVTTEGS